MGNVLTGATSVMGRWKEYSEEVMNEENERKQSIKEVTIVDRELETGSVREKGK